MALWSDPRFSDSNAEQRVDQAFERSGFGLGALLALALVLGFAVFAAVTEIGHPTGTTPTKLADRSIDQPATGIPEKSLPQVPNTQ